jgi:hypothetical protein
MSRLRTFVLRTCLLALVGLLSNSIVLAVGPTLPLRFEDVPEIKDPWIIGLRVDPEQIRVVRIERHIYASGVQVRVEPIEAKYQTETVDRQTEARADLPLRFRGMEDIEQRAFTQEIIIEGQWLKERAAKPLLLQRWFYFIAKGGGVERVDVEEYSHFTDPHGVGADSRGKRTLVNSGRELEGKVNLRDTKGTPALPVGPRGGAIEERPPTEGNRSDQKSDRSEAKEK